MGNELDDARRAYEAAKRISDLVDAMDNSFTHDARILFTNASQDYAQALVDDAQRKLDAMGVVIGETEVTCGRGVLSFVAGPLKAHVESGRVMINIFGGQGFGWVDEIRPYYGYGVRAMTMTGDSGLFDTVCAASHYLRLTLSNVTPADLDAMQPGDVIEGTYKIERMK